MTDNTPRRSRSRRSKTEQSGTTYPPASAVANAIQVATGAEPEQYTHADAAVDAAAGHQETLLYELREARARTDRAKASYDRAREQLDKTVARTITSKPTATNWYDHPGPLDRRLVADATGLTGVALHRVMDRYRKTHGGPARKATRNRR